MLSDRDIREFRGFLRSATDRQVQGIYDKEKRAGRDDYAALAVAEAQRRGLELSRAHHSTVKGHAGSKKKNAAQLDREIAEVIRGDSHATVGGSRSWLAPGVIRAGDRVTIVDRFGKHHTGRAVMRGPHGWVLNLGGRHGTPGIATDENIVRVKSPGLK